MKGRTMETADRDQPVDIAVIGDLSDNEAEIAHKILDVPVGGQCVLYFDSPGGSPYSGISLLSLLLLRDIQATGIVTGECSSAALWPLAACRRRIVTPYSVLLFHPLKWQSEEHVGLAEAAEWARHFGQLEQDMDQLLARLFKLPLERLERWMQPGRYVSGAEFAQAGLAELVAIDGLKAVVGNGAGRAGKRSRVRQS